MSAHSALAEAALVTVAAALPSYALAQALGGFGQALHAAADVAVSAAHGAGVPALLTAIGAALVGCGLFPAAAAACAAATAAAAATAMACGSLRFSLQAAMPSLARISRKTGAARLVSAEGLIRACGSGLAVTLMAVASIPILAREVAASALLSDPIAQAGAATQAWLKVWGASCAVLVAVAAVDVGVQRRRQAARLKMTPREVREERIQTEGRPEMRQRRRAVGARRARTVRIAAIRRATAVVTNPTRLAVALRYAPPEIEVPIVVASAADLLAPVVRAAASAFGVPVIEAPELARELYERVDVDEPIPEECYAAVAAVFTWILRTRGGLLRGDEGDR